MASRSASRSGTQVRNESKHCEKVTVAAFYIPDYCEVQEQIGSFVARVSLVMAHLRAGLSAGTASALSVGAVFAAGVASGALLRRYGSRRFASSGKRVIVAVSGTIQDGFELRKNIDYRAEGEGTVKAVLIGYGVVRGVRFVHVCTAPSRASCDCKPLGHAARCAGENVL